jgi:hypothetical protein
MVHCWEKLKDAPKWRISYVSYNEAVRNGTSMLVVEGEDDEPRNKALPPHPRGHKATKDDLAREVLALPLSQTLEKIMAES